MPTESGFSNQKAIGPSRYKTIHNVGSDKFAENVITKGLVERQAAAIAITAVTLSTDRKEITLTIPAHEAVRAGEVLRFYTGTLEFIELDIFNVVDANNLKVYNVMEALPIIGDTVKTAYYKTPDFDFSGGIIVSPGPIQFVLDGVDTEVEEDTADPTSNIPLPIKPISPFFREFANLDFTVSNVTNAAYVTLVADVGATTIYKIQIFMSSGEPLLLAFGAAAAESDQAIIIPGGNGIIDVTIPPNTRLSVKAVNAVTVNTGNLLINLLG